MKNTLTRGLLLATASTLALTLSACGSDDSGSADSSAMGTSAPSSSASSSSAPMTSSSPSAAAPASDEPFGEACSQVPTEGEGSVEGMSDDPVATAASNNPLLSTLVTAVGEAGLVDTLNGAEDVTVIAPANPAFEALPADQLQAVLDDQAMLTQLLTHHVIEGRLAPEDLAGTHTTLAGDEVTIEGSGEQFTVARTVTGTQASVICGNVQTANATVYVVDQVLAPAAGCARTPCRAPARLARRAGPAPSVGSAACRRNPYPPPPRPPGRAPGAGPPTRTATACSSWSSTSPSCTAG